MQEMRYHACLSYLTMELESAAEQANVSVTLCMRRCFIPAGSPLMSGASWHILYTRSSVPWNGLLPVGGNNVTSILSLPVQSAEEEEESGLGRLGGLYPPFTTTGEA